MSEPQFNRGSLDYKVVRHNNPQERKKVLLKLRENIGKKQIPMRILIYLQKLHLESKSSIFVLLRRMGFPLKVNFPGPYLFIFVVS